MANAKKYGKKLSKEEKNRVTGQEARQGRIFDKLLHVGESFEKTVGCKFDATLLLDR